MRPVFIVMTALALELGACSENTNPPQTPSSQTQTTGGYPSPTTGNPDVTGVMPPHGDVSGYGTTTTTGTGTGTGTMLPSGSSEQRHDANSVPHDRSTDIESRAPLHLTDGGT
jgi:hypothetical protein